MNNSQTRAVRQPGGGARGDGRVSSRRSDGALRVLLVCALATLGACGPGGERERVVGEAWVGPSMVQIRKELNLRSPVSGTLQHDERVDLIARRRRFVKVRAGNGVEGWTDSRLLLSAQARAEFQALEERAGQALALGQATVLDTLSAHTAPYRQAPAYFQIAPKKTVQVIAHQRMERVKWDPPPLLEEIAFKPRVPRKQKEAPRVPPPPPGPPPPVPEDWLLLSGYTQDHLPEEKPNEPPPTPPVMDDWTLVRAEDGRSGWVLDRLLYSSIPDDVAQYAERARIVAYFDIGTVHDRQADVTKTVWLWAAQSAGARDREFDSLRIFNWSTRHHRYETSWIERGIWGAGPVTLVMKSGAVAGFTTYVVEKDGRTMKRDYALQNYRARVIARTAAAPAAPWYTPVVRMAATTAQSETEAPAPSLWQRLVGRINRLRAGSGR
jgi:SH3-like domain-containing protein